MGLKDELVVANDPVEETDDAGRENVSEETNAGAVELVNSADDTKTSSDFESNNEQSVETESLEEPMVEETQEESVVEEEEEEEEEVEDPMDGLKEQCSDTVDAQRYRAVLEECTERVSSKESTEETCTQELFDFLHCVDHCVSKTVFGHLK